MKRQLIGWALSFAVALTVSSNFAAAQGTAAGSGSTAGSNAGRNVGSNEGRNIGSNEGRRVGSQEPNAPGSTNTNNTANRARTPASPGGTVLPGNVHPGTGDGSGWWGGGGGGVIFGDPGGPGTTGTIPNDSTGSSGQPINAGQAPANGTTPPLTGPITPDGSLTTSNVPPPRDSSNNTGLAVNALSRQAQVEGQLVDLLSVSQEVRSSSGVSSAPAAAVTSASGASNTTGAAAKTANDIPDGGATSSPTGSTGSTASVRTTGGDTFGTYARRGATAAPDSPSTPAATPAPPGSIAGKSLIIDDRTPSPAAKTATPSRHFDSTTISRQLSGGMPATIVSGSQMYILACDPRQLASYAGQNIRVSGRVNGNGALIPDRVEVRQAGGFREITLTKPDMPNATATDR